MAKAVSFTPISVDPKLELQRRLAAAPNQHAEALLVAYDLLEEAHRQGILDALHGAIGARDTIMCHLAEFSAQPISINAARNVLSMAKLLGALDPESISKLSKETLAAFDRRRSEQQPPSLWQLFKRLRQPETRRGLSLLTALLAGLGRATE
jgi:uncharacterized protein YjgD (DUF1641 family)